MKLLVSWTTHSLSIWLLVSVTGALQHDESSRGFNKLPNGLPDECTQLKISIKSYAGQHDNPTGNLTTITTEDDNGYEIRVRRSSDNLMVGRWYEPGREYSITLTNRYPSIGFRDAVLWLQFGKPEDSMKMDMSSLSVEPVTTNTQANEANAYCAYHPSRLGTWIHRSGGGRTATQERPGCDGLSAERASELRTWTPSLVLSWRAPIAQSSISMCSEMAILQCVTLAAAVRARGSLQSIFAGKGGLKKTLCPSSDRPPSPVLPADMTVSKIMDGHQLGNRRLNEKVMKHSVKSTMRLDTMQPKDCCACGSATYNLTFQGLWTQKTHPKDWPTHNPGLLHWTNLIGASHMPSYRIYQFGEPASAGVSAVCVYGDTTVLKQSFSLAASNVGSASGVPTGTARGAIGIGPLHSLVTAAGMWSEETLGESRSTLIGVNRTHPLISFLTMLGPSPNWCAGITGQSVCQADCTWIKRLSIDLYPWDAGVRHGNTYIPKNADRKDIPDPIRHITADWMPDNPFTRNLPVARVTLERLLPQEPWQCTDKLGNGVEIFLSDGKTEVVGGSRAQNSDGSNKLEPVKSAMGDLSGSGVMKKSRRKSGGSTSAGDNPLSDPSLAQMATFLCITGPWSPWSLCSVTCGVGHRHRQRIMVVNKKNELCQHVPLVEEESCEGRKRTCDFSSPCSLLPWTEWTPCNATCENRTGEQTRRRYLARPHEQSICPHVFNSSEEHITGAVIQKRECGPTDVECDPATICGEGRKDGIPCGVKARAYYYSAVDHGCLSFEYLGCKGGRNRFTTKELCESVCIPAVEALPAWRRERMTLLQYQTTQIASSAGDSISEQEMKPAEYCSLSMDPGETCPDGMERKLVVW
ncbi:unnamed protein product [Dicrocoelium dendriticum]|nr:unnamed protein product [Dicrocoelium dendriticum]